MRIKTELQHFIYLYLLARFPVVYAQLQCLDYGLSFIGLLQVYFWRISLWEQRHLYFIDFKMAVKMFGFEHHDDPDDASGIWKSKKAQIRNPGQLFISAYCILKTNEKEEVLSSCFPIF